MWAGVWFPSVALSRLWFLHPLCSLQMKCRVHTAGFPFRKPFSLMKVYCGKLYANLFAGLHLGHPSSVFRSYCVLGSGKQVWVQKSTDLNIKSPLMEKKKKTVMGKEPKGLFLSITRYLWARYFTPPPHSFSRTSSRQDKTAFVLSPGVICTAFLHPAILPLNHCCKTV